MTRDEFGKLNFFFGPVSKPEATELAEYLCDSKAFFSDLVEFLQHDFSPGELEYRIQILCESHEEFLKRNKKENAS